MNIIIDKLMGNHLKAVDRFVDQLNLQFEDGWRLAIYNPHRIRSVSGSQIDPRVLVGKCVIAASYKNGERAEFVFDGETVLLIDLSPDAYLGPEALQLNGPNGETIIENGQ